MPPDMPAAEHAIDEPLVRALLRQQHPDLAELPLVELAHGWDNAIYRLGDAFTLRLPRREVAAGLIRHEQRWLPELAPRLPLPVPAPVRTGEPGHGYPWPWSVCPWLEGDCAADAPPDPVGAAEALAGFLTALHLPSPDDAPRNAVRGIPLRDRAEAFDRNRRALGSTPDADWLAGAWRDALALAPYSGPPLWLHGDLHPANLVVRDGRLAAVLDFGDLCGGDPASDLSVAWMLLPVEARDTLRRAVDADPATWERARGWAVYLATAFLANSADNPRMRRVGTETLSRLRADAPRS